MGPVHRLSRCLPDANYSLELLALPSQTMLAAVSCSGFGPVPRVPVPEPKYQSLGGSCPSGCMCPGDPSIRDPEVVSGFPRAMGMWTGIGHVGHCFSLREIWARQANARPRGPATLWGPQRPLKLFKHFQRVPCEVSPAIFLQGCHTHCAAPLELLSQALWTAECSLPLEVQGQRPRSRGG